MPLFRLLARHISPYLFTYPQHRLPQDTADVSSSSSSDGGGGAAAVGLKILNCGPMLDSKTLRAGEQSEGISGRVTSGGLHNYTMYE